MTTAANGSTLSVTPTTGTATFTTTIPAFSMTMFDLASHTFVTSADTAGATVTCRGAFTIENEVIVMTCTEGSVGTVKKILRDGTVVALLSDGAIDPANTTATGSGYS